MTKYLRYDFPVISLGESDPWPGAVEEETIHDAQG